MEVGSVIRNGRWKLSHGTGDGSWKIEMKLLWGSCHTERKMEVVTRNGRWKLEDRNEIVMDGMARRMRNNNGTTLA